MAKTNYQVTFGYKAVLTVSVKADNETDAKKQAEQIMKNGIRLDKRINLEDNSYSSDGILNLDKTWNAL